MAIVKEITVKSGKILFDDSAYRGLSKNQMAARASETRRVAGQLMYEAMQHGSIDGVSPNKQPTK